MNKRSLIITGLATLVALNYFPKKDEFWAYVSKPYLISFISLVIALYLTTKNLRRLGSYLSELSISSQRLVIWILFYTSVPIILCLFFPFHAGIIFFLFSLYQWRVWKEKREVYLLTQDILRQEK